MDFFERQEKARKTTSGLILVYGFFVVALMAAIHTVVSVAVWQAQTHQQDAHQTGPLFRDILLDPAILPVTFGTVALVIVIGSLVKIAALSKGGSQVAESLGGREIPPSTTDYKERRLLNIVEEMAIASGVPMPRVYVLDRESGINAFAAGFSTKDAAVAVTRGSLDLFNREELQAVLGHEFSHILNGDMRLNIRMIAVLSGILGIAIIGQIVFRIGGDILRSERPRRSNNKDNNGGIGFALLAFGAAIWIIGSLGVLCARIMQAMISRQRERLADASSVQFTRNPDAMANALKIIGASAKGGVLTSPHASEVSHMLFASGHRFDLFATHPPLDERIRAIDPRFDGSFDDAARTIKRRQAMQTGGTEINEEEDLHDSLLAGAAAVLGGLQRQGGDTATASGGTAPTPPPVPETTETRIPQNVRSALRTVPGAQACLCAAVLADEADIHERQTGILAAAAGAEFVKTAEADHDLLRGLPLRTRRIVCEMAVNTLRVLPKDDLSETLRILDDLVAADGRIDAFEFALTRMFRCRLLPDIANARRGAAAPASLGRQASRVLGTLAEFGADDPAAAANAYRAGLEKLTSFGTVGPDADLGDTPDLSRFETDLHDLVRLPPIAKREFMNACETVVTHDGALTDVEDNFLFAISDLIEAPQQRNP